MGAQRTYPQFILEVRRVDLSLLLGLAERMSSTCYLLGEGFVPAAAAREEAKVLAMSWAQARGLVPVVELQACRECFCTQERACRGGCFWVEEPTKRRGGLCSRCKPETKRSKPAKRQASDEGKKG